MHSLKILLQTGIWDRGHIWYDLSLDTKYWKKMYEILVLIKKSRLIMVCGGSCRGCQILLSGYFVHTCFSVIFVSILKMLTIFMKSWPSWVLVFSHGHVCPVYLSNWILSNTHCPSVKFDVLILGILTMYVNMSFTVKIDWWCG